MAFAPTLPVSPVGVEHSAILGVAEPLPGQVTDSRAEEPHASIAEADENAAGVRRLGSGRVAPADPARLDLELRTEAVSRIGWFLGEVVDAEERPPGLVRVGPQIAVGVRRIGVRRQAAGTVAFRVQDRVRGAIEERGRDARRAFATCRTVDAI